MITVPVFLADETESVYVPGNIVGWPGWTLVEHTWLAKTIFARGEYAVTIIPKPVFDLMFRNDFGIRDHAEVKINHNDIRIEMHTVHTDEAAKSAALGYYSKHRHHITRPSQKYISKPDESTLMPCTAKQAEFAAKRGKTVVVRTESFWTCPSGASGTDIGFVWFVNGKSYSSATYKARHSGIARTLFGYGDSPISKRFFRQRIS